MKQWMTLQKQSNPFLRNRILRFATEVADHFLKIKIDHLQLIVKVFDVTTICFVQLVSVRLE